MHERKSACGKGLRGVVKMQSRHGFTLVEMLVVIGIIGILIVAMVPVVKGAQTRAKEVAVKTSCANIETALANYAQSHGGNYPGVAVDVMSPFADHALGDPALYDGSDSVGAPTGWVENGVLGSYGHYNNSTLSVFEQLKAAKDTQLAGNEATPRYFDSLVAGDAIQEYPANQFISTGAGQRAKMRNIFRFGFNMAQFDPNIPANGFQSMSTYQCSLSVDRTGTSTPTPGTDPLDSMRLILMQNPMPMFPMSNSWSPQSFSEDCWFGTDDTDYFAPGDFAYVPILSSSVYPFGDSMATLENEVYKWGVNVTGYMLFGYGSKTHKSREFEDEQREYVANGLPGCGGPGIDTRYENYVLQLFEGAIYFSKKT
jgi:prepilin-type N-terminal cleavage/methylation domain-containing protein